MQLTLTAAQWRERTKYYHQAEREDIEIQCPVTPGALVQAYNITWSKEGGFTRPYTVENKIYGYFLTTSLDEKEEHIYTCHVAITNPIDGQIWKQSVTFVIKSCMYTYICIRTYVQREL